jgi:2-polyprenyl-6-methoxyphenol hydroxylase-like FAD-dependent oxidoreductase
VTVLERAPVLREVGAGISLWTNALRALARLGLDGPVLAHGCRFTRGEVRTKRGGLLFALDMARLEAELGAPSVAIHRADLHALLAAALPAGVLRLGADVERVEDAGGSASVVLAGGERIAGAAVVGADGLRSVVRAALWGDEPPRYAGYTAWRTVIDDPAQRFPMGHALEAWGPGARCGAIRLDARRVYFFATVNAKEGARGDGDAAFLGAHFRGWCPPLGDLLELLRADDLLRHDLYDRRPRTPWGRGRVTLLGDAAHPMTPNLGQGACTAIEDALVLADRLAATPDVERALRDYEALRSPRTAYLVEKARFLGRVGQEKTRFLGAVRNALIRLRSARSMHREMLRYVDYRTEAPEAWGR